MNFNVSRWIKVLDISQCLIFSLKKYHIPRTELQFFIFINSSYYLVCSAVQCNLYFGAISVINESYLSYLYNYLNTSPRLSVEEHTWSWISVFQYSVKNWLCTYAKYNNQSEFQCITEICLVISYSTKYQIEELVVEEGFFRSVKFVHSQTCLHHAWKDQWFLHAGGLCLQVNC